MTNWSNAYIGLPWREKGRDRSGTDCYGLLRLIYSNELGIELPSYVDYETQDNRIAIAALYDERIPLLWKSVDQPVVYDGILLRVGGLANHVGVVIDNRRMIHIERDGQSRVDRFDIGVWSFRRLGFYRHVSLDPTR